jgi:hypothetical protein
MKDSLLTALNTLPDGIQEFLAVALPEIESISVPTTTDDAIIAQGVLAANINTWMEAYVGLCPIEMLLRIGQKNEALQCLLLSALEYFGTADFSVSSPADDAVFTDEQTVTLSVSGNADDITAISVTVTSEHLDTVVSLDPVESTPGSFQTIWTPDWEAIPDETAETVTLIFVPTWTDETVHVTKIIVIELNREP